MHSSDGRGKRQGNFVVFLDDENPYMHGMQANKLAYGFYHSFDLEVLIVNSFYSKV